MLPPLWYMLCICADQLKLKYSAQQQCAVRFHCVIPPSKSHNSTNFAPNPPKLQLGTKYDILYVIASKQNFPLHIDCIIPANCQNFDKPVHIKIFRSKIMKSAKFLFTGKFN